jgi:hypothetical protein
MQWHGGLSGKLKNKRKRAGARRHPNKLDACNNVSRSSSLAVAEASGMVGLGRSDS